MAAAAVVEVVLLAHLLRDRGAGLAIWQGRKADLGGPSGSSDGEEESRGAAFGCGRAWQLRWERRSIGSLARGQVSDMMHA